MIANVCFRCVRWKIQLGLSTLGQTGTNPQAQGLFIICWETKTPVDYNFFGWPLQHMPGPWFIFLNQVAGVEYWHSKSCSRSRVNLLSICIFLGLSVDHIEKVGTGFFARDRGQPETTNWQPHQVEPELKLKRSNTYELFLKKNLYLKLFWTLPESLGLNLSINIYNSGLCRPEPHHPLLSHHWIISKQSVQLFIRWWKFWKITIK